MTESANAAVQRAVDASIKEGSEIGVQVAVYYRGNLEVDAWGGIANPSSGKMVDSKTLFCPFSVTKAVTAVALHIQAERGLIDYAAPIARYWPEFGVRGKERATVYDALTHRLGLPFMPADVTPELMCNWEWMVEQLARMHAIFEPGTKSAYQGLTFGWIIGELVRRTDRKRRAFSQFVQDEICGPLELPRLWYGIPASENDSVATVIDAPFLGAEDPAYKPDNTRGLAHPDAVGPFERNYGNPMLRQACLPGAGALMNASSCARLFSMLAELGELQGFRLLSEARVRTFHVARPPADWDMVLGEPHSGTIAGFWTFGSPNMAPLGNHPRAFGHPGYGGSLAWADPENRFAMAIFHNRMFRGGSTGVRTVNSFVSIADAARNALGID